MSNISKRPVEGVLVKLLQHKRTDRGMELAAHETRCFRAGEIHELVTTDQHASTPSDRIDCVGFLGFVEITRAGVVETGDEVVHQNKVLGHVIGFDECHYPNHYNILIKTEKVLTADDANMHLEEQITFRTEPPKEK